MIREIVDDLVLVVGLGMIFYGCYLVEKWLAFTVTGSLIVFLWVLSARFQGLAEPAMMGQSVDNSANDIGQ